MALRLLIIADDLTGALDCACEASARGIGASVFRTPQGLAQAAHSSLPPVIAVSTGSRDGTEAGAEAAMAQVCALLPELASAHVMKKVDSRLKGHINVETGVLMQALGVSQVLCGPAIPDMGRVQRHGHVEGAGVDTPIGIASRLPDLTALVPDILTDADFDTALNLYSKGSLLLGARGLAAALVARLWPENSEQPPPKLAAPALFAIGSRDQITCAQVARLRAQMPALDWISSPNGAMADVTSGHHALRVLQLTEKPGRKADQLAAARCFAQTVATVVAQTPVTTLLACGGQTADALLARLGVSRIDVEGALSAGVAVGRIALSEGTSLRFVTKSGGFGGANTLLDLARMIGIDDNIVKISRSS